MLFTSIVAAAIASVAVAAPAEESSLHQHRKRYISDNWCGAVKSTTSVSVVEATWIVPSISIPSNATNTKHYSSYQWIGMGGDPTCGAKTDLLQAGTGAEIVNGGNPFYYPYFQLWPSTGPRVSNDLTVSPGDKVYVKVTRDSTTSGTFYWENLTTGFNDTKSLTSNAGHTICQKSVEWIHERPGNPRRPFPNFSSFSFTKISATGPKGANLNLKGAEDWIMTKDQTDERLCHPKHNGDTQMAIIQDNEWTD
ncbi:hypothetical protein PWT90_09059 [Aphanocladium album]|nr:hypothetical protein PWT90_09059 [Aphanocladium album]